MMGGFFVLQIQYDMNVFVVHAECVCVCVGVCVWVSENRGDLC